MLDNATSKFSFVYMFSSLLGWKPFRFCCQGTSREFAEVISEGESTAVSCRGRRQGFFLGRGQGRGGEVLGGQEARWVCQYRALIINAEGVYIFKIVSINFGACNACPT